MSHVLRAARAAVAGYGDAGAAGLRADAERLGIRTAKRAAAAPAPVALALTRGMARPETPRLGEDGDRSLFSASSEYSYRPSSSYGSKVRARPRCGSPCSRSLSHSQLCLSSDARTSCHHA